jgi:hypothetical protein
MGFKQSLTDPCLYIHPERKLWLLIYDDGIAAAALKSSVMNWFFTRLSSKFDAKPLGEGT